MMIVACDDIVKGETGEEIMKNGAGIILTPIEYLPYE
jgi:hypothetical protein